MIKWLCLTLIFSGCQQPIGKVCPGFMANSYGSGHWSSLPVPIALAPEIPIGHQLIMIDAMKAWNDAFKAELFRIDNHSPYAKIVELNPWTDPLRTWEQANTNIHWTQALMSAALVQVNTQSYHFLEDGSINGVHLKSLIIHELGHVLGLDHTDKTVMNPVLETGLVRDQIEPAIIEQLKCHYSSK